MRLAAERALSRTILRLPTSWLLRLVGEGPRVVDGQTLDPQLQFGLALERRRKRRPPHTMTPAQARASIADALEVFDVPREPVGSARDWQARCDGGRPVRVRAYTPVVRNGGMLVFFHGGGGVVGSVESYDRICRHLANSAEVIVLSVDYRLAPEHGFPCAIDDALTAYRWAATNAAKLFCVDPDRIAVGGDSMGANFAAVLCLRCRAGEAPMPAYQWLLYPGTELTRSRASHRTFATGYVLEEPLLDWFSRHYLAGHSARDPLVSPLHAESFEGLPSALVVTAGFDPLRDEGHDFADRLADAGVSVRYQCHRGLVHGFIQMGGLIDAARAAIDEAAVALRDRLSRID